METSDLTARQIYQQIKDNPSRARFGFGKKAILVNVDPQKAYTRTDLFKTAYETDPKQLDYVNQLATAFRALDWPVVWTYVAFMESGEDCGIWGTRTDTPDSLQNKAARKSLGHKPKSKLSGFCHYIIVASSWPRVRYC